MNMGFQLAETLHAAEEGGVVLVADDDDDVRKVICRYLEAAGYETLSAVDGEDALRILQTSVRPVKLLVCDIGMPGIPGPDVARLADKQQPGIAVLFVTGGDPPSIPQDYSTRWDYLLKPMKQSALALKARVLLAQ